MKKHHPFFGARSQTPARWIAQGLVEFALAMPILLLIVYGALEVGRLVFIDSMIISAAREAARYGSANGLVNGSGQYTDCTGIRAAAQKLNFLNAFDDSGITISYDHGPGTTVFATSCPPTSPVASGDRIIVRVSGTFTPLSAIVPLSPMTLTSQSERTLLDKVVIVGTPLPSGNMTLTVNKSGIGNGTITSSPSGIACNTSCSTGQANFSTGTVVTLTAAAASGSTFTGWSGSGCSGTGTCVVTMSTAKQVSAGFDTSTKTLTFTKNSSGTGTGTVTSSPSGISCGTSCNSASYAFASGTSVTLTENPASGMTFIGWSGACSGTATTCVVTMSLDAAVSAKFNANNLNMLTVGNNGDGAGTISSSPAGISCGATCAYAFANNTNVTLTASASAGSTFLGWSGASCSGTGTCSVTMNTAYTILANFDANTKPLAVSMTGDGTGTLTSSPAGINCGSTCTYSFNKNTSVTLTAAAGSGSTFTGWSGAGCSGTGTCVVSLSAAKSVVANFDSSGTKTMNLTISGTGSGGVTSSPIGINCRSSCLATFTNNLSVTLTAMPDLNSYFNGWGGACSGTSTTCTVTMDSVKSVTATFNILSPCAFTFTTPSLLNSSKTISWTFSNTVSGTAPQLDFMVVFWSGGYLNTVTYDGTSVIWSGNQSPTTFAIDGGGMTAATGSHTITFDFSSNTIKHTNFNATLFFVPPNCPIITTGSWYVQ